VAYFISFSSTKMNELAEAVNLQFYLAMHRIKTIAREGGKNETVSKREVKIFS
jgi:hypothetical protein